jgi:ribonuclease D
LAAPGCSRYVVDVARGGRPDIFLVSNEDTLRTVARRLEEEAVVALDIESNGMHAYKATLCVLQLAAKGSVVIVDPLATKLDALGPLLASEKTTKLVHDVSFDARILAESGLTLANVKDTSVAARMLARSATGLGSLLSSELGIDVDKKMQHHDWAQRPLDRAALAYLGNDVVHLDALADRLFAEVDAKGIAAEVDEETRYRLAQSIAAAGSEDPRPPYVRLKGIDKLPEADLAVLRHVAQVREDKARALDVPPYKVLAPDVLVAIAQAKPRTAAELAKIKGATQGRRAASLEGEILRAVAAGVDEPRIPEGDRVHLERPRLPSRVARQRRAREQRLSKWRRDEAQKRGVDEQVVLPGHCLQDLADLDQPTLDEIAQVPGLGTFRVERDGAALVATLALPSAAEPST